MPSDTPVRNPFATEFATAPPRRIPHLVGLPSTPAKLLTVAQVAEVLGLSKATVYMLVQQGRLPHVRISNSIRIRPADLEAFIAQGGAR